MVKVSARYLFAPSWALSPLAAALLFNACQTQEVGPTSSMTLSANLACIEPILVSNCATSGCHDSITQQHGMDLSTSPSIYDSLVNRDGLEVCRNVLKKRVVPGDPDNSFVLQKVTGQVDCNLSQRMPPPPAPPLPADQIEMLRAWIATGAPPECGPGLVTAAAGAQNGGAGTGGASGGNAPGAGGTAGSVPAAGASATGGSSEVSSGGTGGDAANTPAGGAGTAGTDDTGVCTADSPCTGNSTCTGGLCSDTWECFSHKPHPIKSHPCSENIISFCGCDGATFESPQDCPDRPWDRVGPCEEGYNCDPWKAECDVEPPVCAESELPSVVDGCWGPCVPITSCRCLYFYECGDVYDYSCVVETLSCDPGPAVEDGAAGAPPEQM